MEISKGFPDPAAHHDAAMTQSVSKTLYIRRENTAMVHSTITDRQKGTTGPINMIDLCDTDSDADAEAAAEAAAEVDVADPDDQEARRDVDLLKYMLIRMDSGHQDMSPSLRNRIEQAV